MSASPEIPQPQPTKSFPYREVNVRGISGPDVEYYGTTLGDIARIGSITREQIRGAGDTPGIHSMADLANSRLFAALPIALSDLAERSTRLGLAEEIQSPSGVHKVQLVDTDNGRSQIEITTHKDYRQVRIVDTTDKVVVGDELYPRTLFSLQFPNHMKDPVFADSGRSNFRATRHDRPGAIDPGVQDDEATVQAFAGVICDVAERIASALPEEGALRKELERRKWRPGGDYPSPGGGGGPDDPNRDNPSGGGGKEDDRELVRVPAVKKAEEITARKEMQAPLDDSRDH